MALIVVGLPLWAAGQGGGGELDWLVTLLFWILIPPACVWLLWLRYHESRRDLRARGICVNCHYDLRATPHRCPECGHVVGQ